VAEKTIELSEESPRRRAPLPAGGKFFLVGFMGAGKTTLGRCVAERMGLPFFDLDDGIEQASGMTVAEIFSRGGEDEFRRRESLALRELVDREEEAIVATGGGAFTVESNRRLMLGSGVVVWLDALHEEIAARAAASTRPLWTRPEEARLLHERRKVFYQSAHLRLDLAGCSVEEGAERLHRLLLECRRDP
jgi:shikimate kinase